MPKKVCPGLFDEKLIFHFWSEHREGRNVNVVMVTKGYLVSDEYCKSFCFGEGCKYWDWEKNKCTHPEKISKEEAKRIVEKLKRKYRKSGFKVIE